jgi:hypothetical protein
LSNEAATNYMECLNFMERLLQYVRRRLVDEDDDLAIGKK